MSSIIRPFKRRKVASAPSTSDYKLRLAKYKALSSVEFQETFLNKDDLFSYKPKNKSEKVELEFEYYNTGDLSDDDFAKCFALLRATSQVHYANSERGWDEEFKHDEMSEDDMKFVLVKGRDVSQLKSSSEIEKSTASPAAHLIDSKEAVSDDHPSLRDFGFLSFKLDDDDTAHPRVRVPVVYVYEIHLGANLRSLGLGKHLMKIAESIARQAQLDKVILSVFTVNEAAEQFYRKLGYVTDETSPQPKKTRKRVIPPQWLYLSLPTKDETEKT